MARKPLKQLSKKQRKLVEEHADWVRFIVKRGIKYRRWPVRFYEDMVSFGSWGLTIAAITYDSKKNSNFKSYATFKIECAIKDGFRKEINWLPIETQRKLRASGKEEPKIVQFVEFEIHDHHYTGKQQLEVSDWFNTICNKLKFSDRDVLILRERIFNEKEMKAIAKTINVTESRVCQLLSSLLPQLKVEYDKAIKEGIL